MMLHHALLALFACALQAAADPAWKAELSPATFGPHAPVRSGSLDLTVSWKGMLDAGKLTVKFAPKDANKPNTYVVTSSAASLSPAASLFPFQSHFWAELDPSSFQPRLFHAVETDRQETVTTTTRFTESQVSYKETTTARNQGTPSLKQGSFQFAPVLDIFAAMLYVRSQKLDPGDRLTFVVQPFKTPYLVHVNVDNRELHLDRHAIRLTVGMRKIHPKTLDLMPYKKMTRDATLWLSDDADRMPIEFRAAVFIGDVRAVSNGFHP